jgi:hypothetical protein
LSISIAIPELLTAAQEATTSPNIQVRPPDWLDQTYCTYIGSDAPNSILVLISPFITKDIRGTDFSTASARKIPPSGAEIPVSGAPVPLMKPSPAPVRDREPLP